MRYYFAPMEGVNGCVYRRLHHAFFPGVDRYFIPFLSPTQHHTLSRKEYRDLCPENNRGVPTVPQVLTRRAEDFIWAAGVLKAMGYEEVNLNLGCPSGTVVAKGKGAGFLGRLEELEAFLDTIFGAELLKISIKTRLGLTQLEEFGRILELYNRYPIAELTIHPRVQKDFYKRPARMEEFEKYWTQSRSPLCYNGDLVTREDCEKTAQRFSGLPAFMLGRGLVADPALVTKLRGGAAPDRETLRQFHDALYEGHGDFFESRRNAMLRMKEIWYFHIHLFEDHEKVNKKIRKASDCQSYERAVDEVFATLPLREDTVPNW